jgi:DNA recombination protein RmuC
VEPAYILAAQREPSLFEDAFKQRILIAGPTTLLAMLRTVESIWRVERQNLNSARIAEAAVKIYEKLQGAIEDFDKVGRQLESLQKSYSDARGKLFTGNANLIRQGEQMKKLGLKSKKAPSAQLLAEAGAEEEEETDFDAAEALPSEEEGG